MLKKIILLLLWVSFIIYAFIFAPPNQPETFTLIKNLSTGNWEGINPLIISLFNLMGIWPLIYACVLLIDGKEQKIKATPFVIASFAVGAFAILPYLALRERAPNFTGEKDWLLKLIDSRFTGVILTLVAMILLGYGILKGDWVGFVTQWQTSRFIQVMSLDFCLLSLLFPLLLGDDLARRGLKNPWIFWLVSLFPLIGPLVYLSFRPSLNSSRS
jgi:hypothetical protein